MAKPAFSGISWVSCATFNAFGSAATTPHNVPAPVEHLLVPPLFAGLLRRGDLLFPAVLVDPRECGNGPGRDRALAGERHQRVICAHQPAGNLCRTTTAGAREKRIDRAHVNPSSDLPELRARHRKRIVYLIRQNNQVREASLANASTGLTALFHLSAIWRTRPP